ncbi:MAG TPA: 2-C-methyl-D-erythritol 2,4-cyclodiphosphate synthase [Bacteroidetes bacterium]|nr:2-C-methyl-D-erythritol 2,4-cyclodiphosphate synthase [Bacteroidota bacterium]
MTDIRVGFGHDVHPLGEHANLCIGGLIIPHHKGTVGHSDGDALIHAICDALLGAANLRDIGVHFPDKSPKYSGIDSKILLRETLQLIRKKGFDVGNIDTVICLQAPKIMEFIPQMKKILASVIGLEEDRISIKATTTEKLGFIGREEGIAAYATVLIRKEES